MRGISDRRLCAIPREEISASFIAMVRYLLHWKNMKAYGVPQLIARVLE